MTTPQAFDSLASDYDNLFTNSQIGHYLRRRVHARLDRHFFAGDHVLELGCGTGEDALYLAKRGVRVTATDASAAMLAVARNKAGDHPLITLAHLDLRNLPEGTTRQRTPTNNRFGGAFSNFGAVNVLSDWRKLSKWLAGKIKPGGIVGLGGDESIVSLGTPVARDTSRFSDSDTALAKKRDLSA
jgi:SAM-dependent methyltransferase